MTVKPRHRAAVAVIGAGIAGLSCARALQSAGHAVWVFDKSRGPGGRCATRRSAAGPFDHGAPGFGAAHADFADEVARWATAGLVARDGTDRWLALPGMNALPQALADGIALQAQTHIAAIEPADGGRWVLRAHDVVAVDGRFDAVAVALPAEQAAVLLAPAKTVAEPLRGVHSEPCCTVMAAWPRPLPRSVDRPIDAGGPLAMALLDSDRPGRPPVAGVAQRWVLHATPVWSRDNLDVPLPDTVRPLLDAFAGSLGVRLAPPSHAVAHRWRYAQVRAPLAEPCGWDDVLRLGACGDAWHGGDPAVGADAAARGIERAWLSGRALAQRITASL